MVAGLIFSGILIGAFAGIVGLASGLSVWAALLVYSGIGALCLLSGAMIAAIRGATRTIHENSLPIAQPDR